MFCDCTGTILDSYMTHHDQISGTSDLSESQNQWLDVYKAIADNAPVPVMRPPKYSWCHPSDVVLRKKMFALLVHPWFDNTMLFAIIVNVVVMAIPYYQMPSSQERALGVVSYVLTFVFLIELIVKLLAFGWTQYVSSWWNIFDACVVPIGIVEFIVAESGGHFPVNIVILRMFRILRVLRVGRGFQDIIKFIRTLLFALPEAIKVFLLLLVIYFLYAILGMWMFGRINHLNPAKLNDHINFRTFYYAIMAVGRTMTGPGWNLVRNCLFTYPDHFN